MVFSSEELQISNKTYINKDFPMLYNELLDIAQKISYKYDPTTSNESDPMIVLCKLIALIGDKLNYNVDKNILERFLPSITQWNAMQERTSSLGYNMHYYQSAIGYISMQYKNSLQATDLIDMRNDIDYIKFPRFETKFSNSANNVNYVLLETLHFTKDDLLNKRFQNAKIIQGELQHFTTLNGDESLVTLDDLDNNNRLYFPEAMVAQNGVFIEQNGRFWEQVDNLNVQIPLARCFIFRYDSKRKLPYIQFPDDISSLIEGGLTIRYIITNGENGNVSANSINTLLTNGIANFELNDSQSELFDSLINGENYEINNPSSLTNGVNIEDIDEAYNNFQKTVGTLDTLVTCRDYANYIYNLSDDEFNYLVSNVQVCDRRDDFNYSTKVVTYDDFGQSTITKIKQNTENNTNVDAITAFDLILYTLQPMQGTDIKAYKSSFKTLKDTSKIERELEASKCLSHNYKKLSQKDVYAFKNYYKLKAQITTSAPVNDSEQVSIRDNIIGALINNFNAREVDYGVEIPFDTILKVIENADSRIANVSLNEPEVDTYILFDNNAEVKLFENSVDSKDTRIQYFAKNILAGKISLYEYDENFKYDFGQSNIKTEPEVKTLSTCAFANYNFPADTAYTLQANEVVQILSPSFINGREWSYGWFYKTVGLDTLDGSEKIILLGSNNYIEIYESTVEGSLPKFVLNKGYVKVKDITPSSDKIRQITSGASIIEQTINTVTLDETLNVYWLTNNIKVCRYIESNNSYEPIIDGYEGQDDLIECSYIDWDGLDYVLLDGEYLYVTDNKYSFLNAYGPGTKLHKSTNKYDDLGKENNPKYLPIISQNEIQNNGLVSIKDKFKQVQFNKAIEGKQLILTEQQILTLVENDEITPNFTLKLSDNTEESSKWVNKLYKLNSDETINYTLQDGTYGIIDNSSVAGESIYYRARLDINCNSEKNQLLLNNQYVYVNDNANKLIDIETTPLINSKYPISIIGGKNRLVQYYLFVDNEYKDNSLKIYSATTDSKDITKVSNKFDNYYKLSVVNGTLENTIIDNVNISVPTNGNKDTLFMIYVNSIGSSDPNPYLTISYHDLIYNTNISNMNYSSDATLQLHNGINVLRLNIEDILSEDANIINVAFNGNSNNFTGSIIIAEPTILKDTYTTSPNPYLGIDNNSNDYSDILNYINENYQDIFYYNLIVNNSSCIDKENLSDTLTLFDVNNIINKITIPEIDIDYAVDNITIAKSSRKK